MYHLLMPLYVTPLAFSVLYLWLQKIEDMYHRAEENKAFKDKRHFIICLFACLMPIGNIVISYIAIKTTLKSIFR